MNPSMGILVPRAFPGAPRPTPRPRREHGHCPTGVHVSMGIARRILPCLHASMGIARCGRGQSPREHGHCPTGAHASMGIARRIRAVRRLAESQRSDIEIGRT